jgi:hypothetical protein
MKFVYATRPLPKLEFATANKRDAIPDNAEVFAVCDGALTLRQQDEYSLSTLTEQEQTALQDLITESQLAEVTSSRAGINGGVSLLRRILRRLLNT